MLKHIDITIIGKIENIGFRFQVMMAAYNQNVRGIIKYASTGTAYIEVEGTQVQLDSFIEACKNAPGAIINDLKIATGKIKDYQDFEII